VTREQYEDEVCGIVTAMHYSPAELCREIRRVTGRFVSSRRDDALAPLTDEQVVTFYRWLLEQSEKQKAQAARVWLIKRKIHAEYK
jgi:hypothetical protein